MVNLNKAIEMLRPYAEEPESFSTLLRVGEEYYTEKEFSEIVLNRAKRLASIYKLLPKANQYPSRRNNFPDPKGVKK